jgi:hypothetical protein
MDIRMVEMIKEIKKFKKHLVFDKGMRQKDPVQSKGWILSNNFSIWFNYDNHWYLSNLKTEADVEKVAEHIKTSIYNDDQLTEYLMEIIDE